MLAPRSSTKAQNYAWTMLVNVSAVWQLVRGFKWRPGGFKWRAAKWGNTDRIALPSEDRATLTRNWETETIV